MTDYVYKGQLQALNISFAYGIATASASEAVVRHACDPVAAHVLARALCAGVLSATDLATDERLNLRWQYSGALRTVLVDVNDRLEVRGFVSPTALADTLDRDALFGDGARLTTMVSRDGRVLNHGTSEPRLQDVVRDLSFHRATSAQIEAALVVLVAFRPDPTNPIRMCRGIYLQALPGCDPLAFDAIRTRLEGDACRALLQREGEADSLFETILQTAVGPDVPSLRLQLVACPTPRFQCTCDSDRLFAVLRAIPYADRMEMARERKGTAVTCRFCSRRYEVTIDDCILAWNAPARATEA